MNQNQGNPTSVESGKLRPGSRVQLQQACANAMRLFLLMMLLFLACFITFLCLLPARVVLFRLGDSYWMHAAGILLFLLLCVGLILLLHHLFHWFARLAGCIQGFACPHCHKGFRVMPEGWAVMSSGKCVHCDATLFTDAERLPPDPSLTAESIKENTKQANNLMDPYFCGIMGALYGPMLLLHFLEEYHIPSEAFWEEAHPSYVIIGAILYFCVIFLLLWKALMRHMYRCPHCGLLYAFPSPITACILETGNCPRCGNHILRQEESAIPKIMTPIQQDSPSPGQDSGVLSTEE